LEAQDTEKLPEIEPGALYETSFDIPATKFKHDIKFAAAQQTNFMTGVLLESILVRFGKSNLPNYMRVMTQRTFESLQAAKDYLEKPELNSRAREFFKETYGDEPKNVKKYLNGQLLP
jgi:hypothetical protein